MAPELGAITRHNGIAGQVAYSVPVTYPGEGTETVMFIGTIYAEFGPGRIVMVTDTWSGGISVDDPSRFGHKLGPEWVRAFFAPKDN
jgi:hypothetical protein